MAVDTQLTTAPDPTVIYGLIDPRTQECRYVGKAKDAVKRGYLHVCESQLRRKTYKNHWIKSLLREGQRPEMIVLEETTSANWKEAETFWIGYLRFLGARLTNATSGGDGVHDPSPEAREKMGAACRGKNRTFTPEHKAKIAAANRRRATDPAWLMHARSNLAKNRNLRGHDWSQEARQRASMSGKRRWIKQSKEERLAFSAAGFKARVAKYKREIFCAVCETKFSVVDIKAMYCSGTCRQRAYRQRQSGAV